MTLVRQEPSSPPSGKLSQRSPSRKTLRSNWNAWVTWLLKISLKYSLRRKGEAINAHIFRIGCKQNRAHRQKMLGAKDTHMLHQRDKGTRDIQTQIYPLNQPDEQSRILRFLGRGNMGPESTSAVGDQILTSWLQNAHVYLMYLNI